MIMDQSNKEDNESMDDPADGGALPISEGPMTRARSKQLKKAIGGLLKTSLKQEEKSKGFLFGVSYPDQSPRSIKRSSIPLSIILGSHYKLCSNVTEVFRKLKDPCLREMSEKKDHHRVEHGGKVISTVVRTPVLAWRVGLERTPVDRSVPSSGRGFGRTRVQTVNNTVGFPLDRADRTAPSDHAFRTDRVVYRLDPRTSKMELRPVPRPTPKEDLSPTVQVHPNQLCPKRKLKDPCLREMSERKDHHRVEHGGKVISTVVRTRVDRSVPSSGRGFGRTRVQTVNSTVGTDSMIGWGGMHWNNDIASGKAAWMLWDSEGKVLMHSRRGLTGLNNLEGTEVSCAYVGD
ncbi:hypothetical protein DY000_02030822 [Brassica cretica]|uniref:Uncharacterized protein n=1 Tax=Brassica cretica TaxID=69181 RepID=A0ABQ7DLE1_BRACR|nr:hypothetical protein DY000_02030822 [Brassica cretica]